MRAASGRRWLLGGLSGSVGRCGELGFSMDEFIGTPPLAQHREPARSCRSSFLRVFGTCRESIDMGTLDERVPKCRAQPAALESSKESAVGVDTSDLLRQQRTGNPVGESSEFSPQQSGGS